VYREGKLDNCFDNSVVWLVGEGTIIKFWEDKWTRDDSPCKWFPRFYAICTGMDRTNNDMPRPTAGSIDLRSTPSGPTV